MVAGEFPTATVELVPTDIEIDGDFEVSTQKNLERELNGYEKVIVAKLEKKYYFQKCNIATVKGLKQELIKLSKDEDFLNGYNNKLDYLNIIFERFVTNPQFFEKEKLKLEDLNGRNNGNNSFKGI